MDGWIKLHRKIRDHEFFKEKRSFSKFEAWIDILLQVQYEDKPKKVLIKNQIFTSNRGECLYSIRTWAQRWGWSEKKAHAFFRLLEKNEKLVIKKTHTTTHLLVVNYAIYQDEETPRDIRRKDDGKTMENNIRKKERKEINNITPDSGESEIQKVIKIYNELFKKEARVTDKRTKMLKSRRMTYSLGEIITAVENFSKSYFHTGSNNRGWIADPDFMLRADEQIDKGLNLVTTSKKKSSVDPLAEISEQLLERG